MQWRYRRPPDTIFLLDMKTLRLSVKDEASIEHAAGIIRAGGLVAFPTETVGIESTKVSRGGSPPGPSYRLAGRLKEG